MLQIPIVSLCVSVSPITFSLFVLGSMVDGMALDLSGRRLYYTDTFTSSIYRVSIEQNNPEIELVLDLHFLAKPRDIVLDVANK